MKPFNCVEMAFAWLNSIGCQYNPVSFLSNESESGFYRPEHPYRITLDGVWYDQSHRYDDYLNGHSIL